MREGTTPTEIRHVAVVDIGKSNAKVALVDLAEMAERAVRKTSNPIRANGPYPHHDVERLWDFILQSLAELNRDTRIEAISVTTHGATAALVDKTGQLALPVLDYEHAGPDISRADYAAVRPGFSETGSPPLPLGLNLAAQIYWQQHAFPESFARVRRILTYPQYWAFRLSGIQATEATSLGCHTDLWNPATGDFSSLVDRVGWREVMAPVRRAGDRLGPILPELAARTGLAPDVAILCGIHDSNASLLPHLLSRPLPFAVVSTGTWVVVLAPGGEMHALDPRRDTLINVDALGRPVPSARFMGGREYSVITDGLPDGWGDGDVKSVLARGIKLLPSVLPGSGPFPSCEAKWIGQPSPQQIRVAAAFYLALMAATCLDLVKAEGPTIVEGPCAANPLFLSMLSAASGRPVIAGGDGTGTSLGTALLAREGSLSIGGHDRRIVIRDRDWQEYALAWRTAAENVGDWRSAPTQSSPPAS
ncbi:MAG TPA: FGGY-family carbohydrate kinase [Rhizobiaceae bacterium]|nr:FGGY-family carbohydrate kinase [Rhizobiaceae bacterium]